MSAPAFLVSQSAPPVTASAGALGLFVLLAMGLATALLITNMNKRLKRLPTSFDVAPGPETPLTAAESSAKAKTSNE